MTLRSPRWAGAAGIGLALTLLPLATAEAGKKRITPDVVEDALAYATTDRDRAIQLLEQSLTERSEPVVELHLAEQLRLAGDADAAREHFVGLQVNATAVDRAAADLGLALLDASDGDAERVWSVLERVSEKEALATQNADRFLWLAVRAAREGDSKEVASASKKALTWAKEDPEVLERVRQSLSALADGRDPEVDGQRPSGDDPLASAEALYLAGDLDKALAQARKAVEAGGEDLPLAQGLVRNLEGAAPDPRKIVVLLPLSGKYESVGAQVRDAFAFGYGTAPVDLVVVDSGSTPETAVQALEKAVLEDGALAVVGPLLTDETDAVVAAAEALHVPLLSLSQVEAPGERSWTFQAMYTRGDQVDALLDYVTKERGMDSFAVFSPENSFGQLAVELFTAGVAERGGKVTTSATYSPEETSLIPYAKKLGTRTGNLAELRRTATEAGLNPNSVVLPPVLDFDAIFLPESANRTPVATAALAVEEFPMGDYVPQGPTKTIPLLGLSTWNTTSLVTQGNEYTRNSLFPDVFSSAVVEANDPFVAAYKGKTGRTPTALEAAMVDAGKLLAAAARTAPDHRGAMREALLEANVQDAVTGATGFHPETLRARRTMWILTITRQSLEQVGTVELDGS